ncbi:MAG: phosphotransferase [Roseovarius sp.]|nr:phosphotransferase [Roseovarius sp.]
MYISNMSLENSLKHLNKMVRKSLHLWDIPDGASVRLLNISENLTYMVESQNGFAAILRVHRENYHTKREIECELKWLKALDSEKNINVPKVYEGINGELIQEGIIEDLASTRDMVLFKYIKGEILDESDNLGGKFRELGIIAAHCHNHVSRWIKPEDFQRKTWDANTIFGTDPIWGNWRLAPEVTPEVAKVLQYVEEKICERLEAFGKDSARFNLIHADMRLANILNGEKHLHLIDFDDCGWGWFLYDFATAVSFIEDDPRISKLKEEWVRGYRGVRELSSDDEMEIDTFVMLRRMALLAWIGSHFEAPEPQKLASGFAAVTARLGITYIQKIHD